LPKSLSYEVIIAGVGPERTALGNKAKQLNLSHVQFCNLVAVEHLGSFLRAADIHVVPQRRAAAGLVMPSKLLNIMAVGRPVVVTADPKTDLAAMIDKSGGGVVVEPESAMALAHGLEQLLSNRQQREHCGAAGRNYILSRYTIDRVMGAFARRVSTLVRRR